MATSTNKINQVSLSTLKYINIIDTQGDLISFENLTHSIEKYGVMVPIFIDKDNNIISGNRRVLASNDLQLEFIPAIVVDSTITDVDIEKLKIDFLLTQRNLSYLDVIKIYFYQASVFEKHNEPYTEYMSKLLDCTQRNIQLKVRIGKAYDKAPQKLKAIFQSLDSVKKVPLKTLKLFADLEKSVLKNFTNEILKNPEITHKDLVSLSSKYTEVFNRKKRHATYDEEIENAKDSKEENMSEDEINELNSLANSSSDDTESKIILDLKKVFQYEIKKHFKVDVQSDEKSDIERIKSQTGVNFKEEIELISSLLKGAK